MCSMFASEPVSRLSTQITRLPRASSSSHRCEPRKPAPPVTRQVAIAAQPTRSRAGQRSSARAAGILHRGHEHRAHGDRGAPDDRAARRARTTRAASPTRGSRSSALYTADDLPASSTLERAGRVTRSRAGSTARCTASSRGRCASTRATRRRRSQTSATATCSRKGSTGLSMAFDLPTQLGLDSDDPRCLGEVGPHRRGDRHDRRHAHRLRRDPARPGVDVDDDQRARGVPAAASTSWSREEQGVPARAAARDDAERHAQGVHRARQLHLPAGAVDAPDDRPVRSTATSGSRAGTRSRSPATTSARRAARRCRRSRSRCRRGIAYVQAAIDAGLAVDEFAPRLAFFFNGHNNVFQEVAKFRAARRMWAHIMRERFGAQRTKVDDAALPHADRRRHADRAAAARTTSCASRCRPSPRSAAARSRCTPTATTRRSRCRPSGPRRSRCARSRSSPHESGATDTVDPFAGSYFVEALTDEIEARAQRADREGRRARRLGRGDRVHHRRDRRVGVGLPGALPHRPGHRRRRQRLPRRTSVEVPDLLRVDPESERDQLARLQAFKADRDGALVRAPPGRAARRRARRARTCCRRSARR